MLVKVFGSAVYGVEAMTITIEVDTPGGKPEYIIVGLPDNAVKESIERITSEQWHGAPADARGDKYGPGRYT